MKRGLPEIQQSFQTCIIFLKAIGTSLQDYAAELKTVRRSSWDLTLEYESFGNSFQEFTSELQGLRSAFDQCKTLLRNAGFPLHRATEESKTFESEVPYVSYEIIKKKTKALKALPK